MRIDNQEIWKPREIVFSAAFLCGDWEGLGWIPLTRHHLAINVFTDAQTVQCGSNREYRGLKALRYLNRIAQTVRCYGGVSVVGEEGGFDYYAYAELGVEFVVVEEAFAVAVVVLEEEVLVLVVA